MAGFLKLSDAERTAKRPTRGASLTAPWKNLDPTKGLSTWEALYHFVDPVRALAVYEYAACNPYVDFNTDPRMQGFRIKGGIDGFGGTKIELVQKLKTGILVARGFGSSAALDAPRQEIHKDRWADLDLDVRASLARGLGLFVSQILVFANVDPSPDTPYLRKQYSAPALRSWYVNRLEHLLAENQRSSRERDYAAVGDAFAGRVPKRAVEALRKELAPASWKLGGRPRKE